MSESLIDQATFDGLKDSVGADFVAEIVRTFSEEVPALLDQLHQAFRK